MSSRNTTLITQLFFWKNEFSSRFHLTSNFPAKYLQLYVGSTFNWGYSKLSKLIYNGLTTIRASPISPSSGHSQFHRQTIKYTSTMV